MASGVSGNHPLAFFFFFSIVSGRTVVFGIRTERYYIAAPFIAYVVSCVALEHCGVAKRKC